MHRRLILVSGILIAAGLACSGLGESSEPGAVTGGETLFSDSFADESSGWEIGNYPSGRVGYWNGVYFVSSLGDGQTMWGLANRGFDDIVINVQSEQITGPSNHNNDYGVMCRVGSDGQGYFFLISGDGFFAILRADSSDQFHTLIDWTSSNARNQGNSANEILASCDGETLTLKVNGELLASVKDSRYVSGDIALTATSYEAESTEVHFDDIEVSRP